MTENNHYFFNFIPIIYSISDEQRQQILSRFPAPKLPEPETTFDIELASKGHIVQTRVLLNQYSIEMTKTQKPYLKLEFQNQSGIIQAKMWDNDDAVELTEPLLDSHTIFDIEGTVDEFRGHKSLTIHHIQPYEGNVEPFSFLPYTKQNIDELTVELFAYLFELAPPYQDIALAAMDTFWEQFRIRPAAKGYHHHYLGGLLKHTVGLMRLARFILKHEDNHFQAVLKLINVVEKAYKKELWSMYNSGEQSMRLVWKDTIDHLYRMFTSMIEFKEDSPNYNALMTSILFHDIGKLLEYDHVGNDYEAFRFLFPSASDSQLSIRKQTGIILDELGMMVGHIPYGVLILNKIIDKNHINLPLEDIHLIAHCILCHHGLPEWGSSVRRPLAIEGYLIHLVDYLDSRYENTETVK